LNEKKKKIRELKQQESKYSIFFILILSGEMITVVKKENDGPKVKEEDSGSDYERDNTSEGTPEATPVTDYLSLSLSTGK
jgi:hypothetical protein